jgi:hypothetical protein
MARNKTATTAASRCANKENVPSHGEATTLSIGTTSQEQATSQQDDMAMENEQVPVSIALTASEYVAPDPHVTSNMHIPL